MREEEEGQKKQESPLSLPEMTPLAADQEQTECR